MSEISFFIYLMTLCQLKLSPREMIWWRLWWWRICQILLLLLLLLLLLWWFYAYADCDDYFNNYDEDGHDLYS